MKISVDVKVSFWRASDFDVELAGGLHDLPSDDVKLSAGLLRAIAAAAGAGVLEIVELDAKAAKAIDGVVQSDEDSLAVYEAAVASGVWLEGHLADVVAQRERQLERIEAELETTEGDERPPVLERAQLVASQRNEAQARLDALVGKVS